MGWRDRVKKSFGDFEDIGEGIQNLKNQEKKRKEGLKTTFIHYPHNTQNPQNRKDGGGDPKPSQGNTHSTVKDQSTPKPTPAQNIPDLEPETNGAVKRTNCPNKSIDTDRVNKTPTPPPEPAGMGPEYDDLWNRAWKLADWIDDPDGATIEARRAKLPELDDLRERMAPICSQRTNKPVPPAAPDPETSPPGTWMPWKSGTATRGRTPENCPARCKKTGKCHALAYFEGKPGRAAECDVSQCSRAKDYKS